MTYYVIPSVQDWSRVPSGYPSSAKNFAELGPYRFSSKRIPFNSGQLAPARQRSLPAPSLLALPAPPISRKEVVHIWKDRVEVRKAHKVGTLDSLRQPSTSPKAGIKTSDCKGLFMRPCRSAPRYGRSTKEFDGFQSCARSFAAHPRLWESSSWKNRVQNRSLERVKRAATLRARVRMATRYLAWLSVNFKVTFPNRVEHFNRVL